MSRYKIFAFIGTTLCVYWLPIHFARLSDLDQVLSLHRSLLPCYEILQIWEERRKERRPHACLLALTGFTNAGLYHEQISAIAIGNYDDCQSMRRAIAVKHDNCRYSAKPCRETRPNMLERWLIAFGHYEKGQKCEDGMSEREIWPGKDGDTAVGRGGPMEIFLISDRRYQEELRPHCFSDPSIFRQLAGLFS